VEGPQRQQMEPVGIRLEPLSFSQRRVILKYYKLANLFWAAAVNPAEPITNTVAFFDFLAELGVVLLNV
jgi:hypothetical protein